MAYLLLNPLTKAVKTRALYPPTTAARECGRVAEVAVVEVDPAPVGWNAEEVGMAQRDRSHGFAFVYVDVAKLLKENKVVREDSPVLISEDTEAVHIRKNMGSQDSSRDVGAVKQIRDNLDRLSVLHHKLHAMLDELNSITGKKKN